MKKVAIIGSGDALLQHAKTWEGMQGVSVVGIVDVDGGNKEYLPQDLQSIYISDLNDLESVDVDLVDICTPVEQRAGYIEQASGKSTHVLSAIPFAGTADEVASTIEKAREADVKLYPGDTLRFSPEYANAQAQAKNNALGRPGVMRVATQDTHPGEGANIFTELGIQTFDWVVASFGPAARVAAKHVQTSSQDGSPVEYGVATLRMENDAIVHVELSWGDYARKSSFELTGDKGMLTHDSRKSDPIQVEGSGAAGETHDMILNKTVLERQLEHFSACFESRTEPAAAADDVLQAMKIAEAAGESVKTNEPVNLKGGVMS